MLKSSYETLHYIGLFELCCQCYLASRKLIKGWYHRDSQKFRIERTRKKGSVKCLKCEARWTCSVLDIRLWNHGNRKFRWSWLLKVILKRLMSWCQRHVKHRVQTHIRWLVSSQNWWAVSTRIVAFMPPFYFQCARGRIIQSTRRSSYCRHNICCRWHYRLV